MENIQSINQSVNLCLCSTFKTTKADQSASQQLKTNNLGQLKIIRHIKKNK